MRHAADRMSGARWSVAARRPWAAGLRPDRRSSGGRRPGVADEEAPTRRRNSAVTVLPSSSTIMPAATAMYVESRRLGRESFSRDSLDLLFGYPPRRGRWNRRCVTAMRRRKRRCFAPRPRLHSAISRKVCLRVASDRDLDARQWKAIQVQTVRGQATLKGDIGLPDDAVSECLRRGIAC